MAKASAGPRAGAGAGSPLTGLEVVVRANGVAAAYAARLLGVMGARVTLLEPAGGTPLRREPPFLDARREPPFLDATDGTASALFAYLAAGAGSVVTDLANDEGRAAAAALMAGADIFIDDTPLAQRAELGLDEAAIAARHPDLVHVSVLPFGATGAKAGWKGEEINLLHASGEGNLLPNGLSIELFPERPPVKIYGHFIELQGGIAAALGALSALWVRGEVGGQFVDIGCQDAGLAVGAFAVQRFGDGSIEHRAERSFRYGGVLPCADGYVELLTLEQRQWEALVELIGRPEWALDAALDDALERSRRGPEINAKIRAWAAVRKVAEIVSAGQQAGVPLAHYATPLEVLHDPHERARGLFAAVEVPGAGLLDMLVAPFRFGREPLVLRAGPPVLGVGPASATAEPRGAAHSSAEPGAGQPLAGKPLAGIRIADFSVHNAGPFATHMLSQLGAEIIKVESAQRPDIFRKPHPVYGRMGPATFDQVASTKLSVRLNLKHPEGIALANRLVAVSDVAAESFRPGVLARLGLGYEALRKVKRDIILLSVSSSGQSGPDSHFAGYAPLFGAWGGLGALTGYADGPPVEMRHVMDHTVGMNAAVAVLAALHHRRATGEGAHVDVSAREVASSLLGEALLLAAAGREPTRTGNDHPRMAPHGVYPAAGEDKWLSIAVANDAEWQAMARLMGAPWLARDPRFGAEAARHANRAQLDQTVADWTRTREANAAAAELQAAGIAAHASWSAADIVADPHLRERRAILDVAEPDGTVRAAVGVPMRLSEGSGVGIHRGTPALGEHEDYVFGELLGLTLAKRRALEDDKAIY